MKKESAPLTCSDIDAFTSAGLFPIKQLQVPASFWDTLLIVYVCFQLWLIIGEPFISHFVIITVVCGVTLQLRVSWSPSNTSAGVKDTAENNTQWGACE